MKNWKFYIGAVLLVILSILFWSWMFQDNSETPLNDDAFNNGDITLIMYHGEGCTCCGRWADYLEDHGVTVKEQLLDNPQSFKDEKNVPPRLRSCHTAMVDGYVVEGHVPIEDIRRLLSERPDAIGISAPGMPPSSPGMDAPFSQEYQIILFDKSGNMSVYAIHS